MKSLFFIVIKRKKKKRMAWIKIVYALFTESDLAGEVDGGTIKWPETSSIGLEGYTCSSFSAGSTGLPGPHC